MRVSAIVHIGVKISTMVVVAAIFSCQSKTKVKMKAFGDPNAAFNRTAPVVQMVSATNDDGSYVTGDMLTITITFSKPINIEGPGHITLALATGATPAVANYQAGDGSDTLSLIYQVQNGDQSADLQYVDVNALTCGADTILRDDNGHDAVLTLPETGDPSSLGGQKHLIINMPTSAGVDKTASTYDDLGLHFEKSVYQTRSTKRLLIKNSEVVGMTQATVQFDKNPFVCTVATDFDASLALASLQPVEMSAIDAAMATAPYGVAQNVTLELNVTGVAPNQTSEQVMLKDFATFSLGSAGFDAVQISGGFQGWMGTITGVGSSNDTSLITGHLDVINR